MLFLLMRVPITYIVVPNITPISEKIIIWDCEELSKAEYWMLPASEWPAPDVHIHLVNLQSVFVMEALFTVRTLESFVGIFSVSLLYVPVHGLHRFTTDVAH